MSSHQSTPPSDEWQPFGTNADRNVQLEFSGESQDGMPIWERVVKDESQSPRFWNANWQKWPEDKPSYTSPTGKPTPKWRGMTVLKLREASDHLADTHVAMRVARGAAKVAEKKYLKTVQELLGMEIQLGSWECADSPTKSCIYKKDDTLKDLCLFCREPSDRA